MGLSFVFQAFNLHFLEQLRILWPFLTLGLLLNLGASLALLRLNGSWRLPMRFSVVTADSWMVFVGLLVLLPFTDSSFGRVKPVAVVFAVIFLLIQAAVLTGVAGLLWWQKSLRRAKKQRGLLWSYVGLHLLVIVTLFYAFWIEPFWIDVSYHQIQSAKIPPGTPPLKIVEISDVHMERWTRRDTATLDLITQIQPDLILLAGDYINTDYYDYTAYSDLHRFLKGLHAKYGVFAVQGVVDNYNGTRLQLPDTEVHLLENQSQQLTINGLTFYLVGLSSTSQQTAWDAYQLAQVGANIPSDALKFLLYQTPDLAPQAASAHYDFYFAGHTHGGQIDLPFYGAVFTHSEFGRKYAGGLYNIGNDSQMYVTRGLGFEGANLPRARFLARPEISVFSFGPPK